MKQRKKLFANILFAAVILAIAAVLLLVRNAHQSGSSLTAELIYGDNNTTRTLSLDEDASYDVDGTVYTGTALMRGGLLIPKPSCNYDSYMVCMHEI